jgi:hypothetical protein
VKSLGRLLLFLLLFAVVAACAFYFSSYFLRRSAAGPVNYHYWIHSRLGLNQQQEIELVPILEPALPQPLCMWCIGLPMGLTSGIEPRSRLRSSAVAGMA